MFFVELPRPVRRVCVAARQCVEGSLGEDLAAVQQGLRTTLRVSSVDVGGTILEVQYEPQLHMGSRSQG